MSGDRFELQVHELISNRKVRLIKIDCFKVDYVLRSTIFFYLSLFIQTMFRGRLCFKVGYVQDCETTVILMLNRESFLVVLSFTLMF